MGQQVWARNFREGPHWVRGMVLKSLGPLTYLIQMSNGTVWKRHVDHVREGCNMTEPEQTVESDYDSIELNPAPQVSLQFSGAAAASTDSSLAISNSGSPNDISIERSSMNESSESTPTVSKRYPT